MTHKKEGGGGDVKRSGAMVRKKRKVGVTRDGVAAAVMVFVGGDTPFFVIANERK